ncbi:MAG TPA: ABC transporter ATP-binding protein, partial [Hellea balneolensis]|nr:ABC transporter ATP-binding protein [Hellea balneolensis]
MSLTLQNLSVGYAGKPVVKDLETTAHAGDFIGLVGPNGAGKSSLLKTLAGILPPLGGDALFGPQSLFSMPRKMRARTLAYLPQDKHANWPLPVQDLITLGRAPHLGSLGKLSGPDKDAVKTAARRSGCEDLLRRNY